MANPKVKIDVGFNIDNTQLNKLKASLDELSKMGIKDVQKASPNLPKSGQGSPRSEWMKMKDIIDQVTIAEQKAFNTKLGIVNVRKLSTELKNMNIDQLANHFNNFGEKGRKAFLELSKAALTTNASFKDTKTLLDRIGETMINTVNWSIASSTVNAMTNGVSQAIGYVKSLDSSLNDIRIVTGKSADEMDLFAKKANDAAISLGKSTTDYTNAALIYYQQGLDSDQADALAETTLEVSNVTKQSTTKVSEEVTAVMNGYQLSTDEVKAHFDSMAAVAADTAADLGELSGAMQKVASAANAMGIDFDDLNAQIATIVSVTRQAPENVGTALKTIYARLGDLQVDGVDEFGVSLGEVSGQLKTMGVEVLDQEGNMRNMSDVITDVANKWDTWTEAQKQAAAVAMAGKRQYNNLIALFDNWDMYTKALKTSSNALGTLDKQQGIFMESTKAASEVFKAQQEDLYDSLLNADDIDGYYKALTKILKVVTNLVDVMGGGKGTLLLLSTVFTRLFSKNIANSLTPFIQNIRQSKKDLEALQIIEANLAEFKAGKGLNEATNQNTEAVRNLEANVEKLSKYWHQMTAEQKEAAMTLVKAQADQDLDYQENKIKNQQSFEDTKAFIKANTNPASPSSKKNNMDVPPSTLPNLSDKNNYSDINPSSLKKVKEAMDNIVSTFDKAEQNIKTVKGEKWGEAFAKQAKKVKESGETSINTITDVKSRIEKLKQATNAAKELNFIDEDDIVLADSYTKALDNIIQKLGESKAAGGKKTENYNKLISQAQAYYEKLVDIIEAEKQRASNAGHPLPETPSEGGKKDPKVGLSDILNEAKLKSTITAISNATSAILGLTSAITTAKGVGEALADDSLSTGDKVGEVFTGIASSAGSAALGISGITSALTAMGGSAAAAAGPVGWILAGLTLIGTVISGIVGAEKKNKEETIEAEKEKAAAKLETANAAKEASQEELESIKDLQSAYQDLKKEYATKSLEDFRLAVYNLCMQHDLQDEAVQALTADYEKLDKIMASVQKKAAEKAAQDTGSAYEATKEKIKTDQSSKTVKRTVFDSNGDPSRVKTIDAPISIGAGKKKDVEKMVAITDKLEAFGLTVRQDVVTLDSYIVADENYYKAITERSEEYKELIESISKIDSKLANKLRDLYNVSKDDIEALSGEEEDYISAESNAFVADYAEKNEVETVSDINKMREAIIKDLQAKIPTITQEDAEAAADAAIAAYSTEFANKLAKTKLIPEIKQKGFLKDSITDDEIGAELDGLTNAELAFVTSFTTEDGTKYNSLAELLKANKDELEIENANGTTLAVNTVLENASDSGFKEGDIDSLYSTTNFEESSGLSRDDFNALSFEEQKKALNDYRIMEGKFVQEHNENIQKQIEQEKELAQAELERLSVEKENLEKGGAPSDVIEEKQKQIDALTDKIAGYDARLKAVSETQTDWTNALKETKAQQSATNDSIDSLQSAYDSLTSITESYNSTGMITMDNLQALMNMDTEYLSALQLQNGQMAINEDALRQVALAKIDEMRAEAVSQAIEELGILSKQKAAEATVKLGAQTVALTALVKQGAAAARGAAADWDRYANSLITGMGLAADDPQAKKITNSLHTKFLMADQVAKQIKSGQLGATIGSKGSGGGSSKDPDKKDHVELLEEPTHKVEKELEKIEDDLKRIQNFDKHSWGLTAQKALEKENDLLDQQLEKYKEKAEIQKGQLSQQRGALEAEGFSFSADGSVIQNYQDRYNQMLSDYNAKIDKYNGMSADGQSGYKDTLEEEKKRIDSIKKDLENYEKNYSDFQKSLDKLQEIHFDQIENEVNQFRNMVDVHLELDDAERKWDDFYDEVVKDVDDLDIGAKVASSLKKLDTYIRPGGNLSKLIDQTQKTTNEVIKQINSATSGGSASMFGDDTKLAKGTLTDYRDKLISAAKEAYDLVEEITENYLDALDEAKDKIDDQRNGWESIGDELEHNIELIKLVSGENSYDSLSKQYDLIHKNNLETIDTNKQARDFWLSRINAEKETLKTVTYGSEGWQAHNEALKKATDNYKDAVKELNSTVEEALNTLKEWHQNQLNEVNDTLDKALSSGLGLDVMEEQWNVINDRAQRYLDNVQRAVQMDGLERAFDDALNATNLTADAQAALNKLKDEEFETLQNKTRLSQFDIDEAKARLEIAKQQYALDEAQQNKSNLRLRRDSQGNYTYQYTGNDSEVDKAEEGLMSAKSDWYELVKARNLDLMNQIIENRKNLAAELQAIQENEDLDDAQKAAARQELYAEYQQKEVEIMQDAGYAKERFTDGVAEYFSDVQNNTVLPQWETTVSKMADDWYNGGENSFVGAVSEGITKTTDLQNEFNIKTQEILTKAGINYEELKEDGIDPTIESLDSLTDSNDEFADSLEESNDLLDDTADKLSNVCDGYDALKTAANNAIMAANSALNRLAHTAISVQNTVNETISSIVSQAQRAAAAVNALRSGGGSGIGGADIGSTGGGLVTINNSGYGSGQDMVEVRDSSGNLIVKSVGTNIQDILDRYRNKGYRIKNYTGKGQQYNLSGYTAYATGGYTGSWSGGLDEQDGRLALLHQKELVLNADDTVNILKAIDMMREMVVGQDTSKLTAAITGSAKAIPSQVLSTIGTTFAKMIAGVKNITNSSDNKNLTINADFSGVKSADEIYQAIMELNEYGLQNAYSIAPDTIKGY